MDILLTITFTWFAWFVSGMEVDYIKNMNDLKKLRNANNKKNN